MAALQTPGQAKIGATDSPAQGVEIRKNQLKPTGELILKIASNGTGYNSNVNLFLMPGLVPSNTSFTSGAKVVDGTNITLTSPKLTSIAAELYDYLKLVKMHITKITVTTSDLDNWKNDNMLMIGKVNPDGRAEVAEVRFADYVVTDGGGSTKDQLVIEDQDFTSGGNLCVMLAALKLSTNMTFRFEVSGTNDNAVITPRA